MESFLPSIDFVYRLFEVESNTTFYIGRSIDMHRRLGEHRLGALHYIEGDEDVYQYASALNSLKIKWGMEVIDNCETKTEHYEDFYINKYRMAGEPIQNMKAGDDGPWMGRSYKTPGEFLQKRTETIAAIAERARLLKLAKKNRIKREDDYSRTLYSFEKPEEKFMSPALKCIMEKRKSR